MRVLAVSLIVALAQGGFLQQQDPSLADQELERIQMEEDLGHPELQAAEGSGADEERLSWDEGDEKIDQDREEEEYSFVQTDDVTDDEDEVDDTKDEVDDSETTLEADDEDGDDASEDGSLDSGDGLLEDETTDAAEDQTTGSTDKTSDEAEEKQAEAKILLSVEEEEAEEFQVPSKQCGVCTKGLWAKEVPTIKACMQEQGSKAKAQLQAKAHQKIRQNCGVEARMRVRKSKKCDSQCASVKHVTPTCKTCVVSLWKKQGAPDFRKNVKVCKDVRCKREVAKEAHLKMRVLAKAQCTQECKVSAALLSVETEDFEEEALAAADEVQAKPVKKEVKKVAKEEKKAEIKYDKKKFAKDWHKEWKHGDVPSYKETYSKDTFPGRKAVVAAEDAQSDGKPGPAGLAGPVGAHLKHSADGSITR